MELVSERKLAKYVEKHIQTFHKKRVASLRELRLANILKRKNPYLFKAKNINIANDLVRTLLDAHLSSQEEGIFGSFLEGLAVFICKEVYGGGKSSAEGIDLEFERDGAKYLVSIKSGPNWGNSGQVKRMVDNFRKAKKILHTNITKRNVVAVNGCCYGIDNFPDKGDYLKLCGQRFWSFISGDDNLYLRIIEPLGHRAKEKNEQFFKEYARVVNRFSAEFIKLYCDGDGTILWDKIVQLNSGVPSRSTA